MLALFLQAAALGLAAAASPGAFQTFLINQTLLGGWRRGIPVAFSVLISDPPVVITILLLLNQLPDNFLRWIGLAGGLFVLYMAWRSFQALKQVPAEADDELTRSTSQLTSSWKIMRRGALMNVLSPGPYTFWSLALGPLLLGALGQSTGHGVAFLIGFYSLFIGGMLGIVLLFHQARRLGPRVVRLLSQMSVAILVIFGLLLLRGALV